MRMVPGSGLLDRLTHPSIRLKPTCCRPSPFSVKLTWIWWQNVHVCPKVRHQSTCGTWLKGGSFLIGLCRPDSAAEREFYIVCMKRLPVVMARLRIKNEGGLSPGGKGGSVLNRAEYVRSLP